MFFFRIWMVCANYQNPYCSVSGTLYPYEWTGTSWSEVQTSIPAPRWFESSSCSKAETSIWDRSCNLRPVIWQTIKHCIRQSLLVGLIEDVPFEVVLENCYIVVICHFQGYWHHVLLALAGEVHGGKIQKDRSIPFEERLIENLGSHLNSYVFF